MADEHEPLTLSRARSFRLFAELREKAHQLRVHPWGVCPKHAVRTARKLDELDALDLFRLPAGRSVGWQNAIGIAMYDERRHIDAGHVLPEILDPCVHAVEGPLGRRACRDSP